MEIRIEREDCISCGACIAACPSVFRFADDDRSEVYHQPQTQEEQDGAVDAAESCPVSIIYVQR